MGNSASSDGIGSSVDTMSSVGSFHLEQRQRLRSVEDFIGCELNVPVNYWASSEESEEDTCSDACSDTSEQLRHQQFFARGMHPTTDHQDHDAIASKHYVDVHILTVGGQDLVFQHLNRSHTRVCDLKDLIYEALLLGSTNQMRLLHSSDMLKDFLTLQDIPQDGTGYVTLSLVFCTEVPAGGVHKCSGGSSLSRKLTGYDSD